MSVVFSTDWWTISFGMSVRYPEDVDSVGIIPIPIHQRCLVAVLNEAHTT